MKRFILKYKKELLFLLFFSLSTLVLALWSHYRPKDHVVQLVYAIFFMAFAIPTYLLMRSIWRENLREPILLGIKKAFIYASRFIMRTASWLPFFKSRGNLLSGSTSVSYDLFSIAKNQRRRREKPPKPPRWRDMDTARKKLGYLYYKIISSHIKKGVAIRSTETPNELSRRLDLDDTEQKIITLYKSTRYNGRAILDEQEITELKDELFD